MKTVNYIGLRETAGIIYVGNREYHYDNKITCEDFMYWFDTRFRYIKQFCWRDLSKNLSYSLWR